MLTTKIYMYGRVADFPENKKSSYLKFFAVVSIVIVLKHESYNKKNVLDLNA